MKLLEFMNLKKICASRRPKADHAGKVCYSNFPGPIYVSLKTGTARLC
jgi:hypothetical protein